MYFCEPFQFHPLYMCTGIFILPLPEIIIFVLSKVADSLLSNHSFNFSNFLRSSSSSVGFLLHKICLHHLQRKTGKLYMSFTYRVKSFGPNTDTWRTPQAMSKHIKQDWRSFTSCCYLNNFLSSLIQYPRCHTPPDY